MARSVLPSRADTRAAPSRPPLVEVAPPPGLGARAFAAGVVACAVAVAAFTVAQLLARPPDEDETLALFVGRASPEGLARTVLGERGGAPLHFALAWLVVHAGGGLGALRLLSACFAAAAVPVLALLIARLADRTVGLVAALLASASWMLLFHGVYGRMYSLFLLTSALSYLALLDALGRGGRGRFARWGVATLATIATHPYGALVLASQALYVLLVRRRLREAVVPLAAVTALGIPFWRTDLVLARRFDVGLGGGGRLGAPRPVLRYLQAVAGDLSSGYRPALALVLALALAGFVLLARRRRRSALLVAAVFATPTAAFLVARLGSSTEPESRHLVFALPFLTGLVAVALVALARTHVRHAPLLAGALTLALAASEVAWAAHRTPALFGGEASARANARTAAETWLARTSRPDDVLFGYDPLYLGAWERNPGVPGRVVPRADARLALAALRREPRPLGRGVWVFARTRREQIARALPEPRSRFEARAFGPFLVVRTRGRTGTPLRFLRASKRAELLGTSLSVRDASLNLQTVEDALAALAYTPSSRSRSTTSR